MCERPDLVANFSSVWKDLQTLSLESFNVLKPNVCLKHPSLNSPTQWLSVGSFPFNTQPFGSKGPSCLFNPSEGRILWTSAAVSSVLWDLNLRCTELGGRQQCDVEQRYKASCEGCTWQQSGPCSREGASCTATLPSWEESQEGATGTRTVEKIRCGVGPQFPNVSISNQPLLTPHPSCWRLCDQSCASQATNKGENARVFSSPLNLTVITSQEIVLCFCALFSLWLVLIIIKFLFFTVHLIFVFKVLIYRLSSTFHMCCI